MMHLTVLALVLALAASPAPDDVERLSLDLKQADLVDVLRYFSEVTRTNIVLDPEVKGTVTARLIDVPWTDALEYLLRVHGLGVEYEHNILRIAPRDKLIREADERRSLQEARLAAAELVTLVIPISYADPEEVARVLRDTVLSPRGRVQVMGAPKLLLVTEVAGARAARARRAARGLDG
jgi:type II secretory pathway component HofQ